MSIYWLTEKGCFDDDDDDDDEEEEKEEDGDFSTTNFRD